MPSKKSQTRRSERSRARPRSDRIDTISFDFRRDLINILGEEHYPYGEYLYHELAANAWDEDATEVQIIEEATQPPGPGRHALYDIVVRDNGNGMDFEKLKEYFAVGGSMKGERKRSERLGRQLIGRIGVGKVSILKVARRWTITTERSHGLKEPVRLTVDVDVDDWIEGTPAFAVRYLKPEGRSGTEIVLHDVHTKLRQDRILRHLQRLPLGPEFMVWRNGEPIPPRQWFGVQKVDIDATAEWQENGKAKRGRVKGEIWIRPETKNKREQAYLKEPGTEREGLTRDPAGIEVRVNHDMITREFFGHEAHGHQVNRLWGWVEADWLPILGNRTDYLRDHPAGRAFYEAVKPIFTNVYNTTVRYEKDRRAQQARSRREDAEASDEKPEAAESDEQQTEHEEGEAWASRYGEVVSQLLRDHPEFAPVVDQPARTARGRPAKDRIYPVRPSGDLMPFERDAYGKEVAIAPERHTMKSRRAVSGSFLRARTKNAEELEAGEITVNTPAGVRLRFVSLGAMEAPYRWSLEGSDELTLDVNTEHKLYPELGRPGTSPHRLYCAWLIALALAERANPSAGQWLSDYIETLSYELFTRWGPSRGS